MSTAVIIEAYLERRHPCLSINVSISVSIQDKLSFAMVTPLYRCNDGLRLQAHQLFRAFDGDYDQKVVNSASNVSTIGRHSKGVDRRAMGNGDSFRKLVSDGHSRSDI